jgi:hypothetical protein
LTSPAKALGAWPSRIAAASAADASSAAASRPERRVLIKSRSSCRSLRAVRSSLATFSSCSPGKVKVKVRVEVKVKVKNVLELQSW